MSDQLATFLRDEIASLLDDEIRDAESTGATVRVGADSILVTDDDGNRYTVTVSFEGPAS